MKKFLLILGLALLANPFTEEAHAYSSQVGVDPDKSGIGNGSDGGPMGNEIETKAAKKSATAGRSEALIAGIVVGYEPTAGDGYTVTRAIAQTERGLNTLAGVVTDVVATGDTSYHRIITKGFARVRYNGSVYAITAGRRACVDASGVVRGCALGAALEATANTGIVPLESKTGSGTDLKVMINLQ